MKKLIYYTCVIILVVILLPLLIVKGCGTSEKEAPKAEKPSGTGIKITVYITGEKRVQEMDLEEYIKGVVAAEMPASFGIEALKAQAVAARTFAYGRLAGVYRSAPGAHDGIDVCTDPAHCQAWISKENAMKNWGIFFASRNWAKIEGAVNETAGIIVTYDGKIANTLFHSNSGGMTENSEEVWDGTYVPYLRSVVSKGEDNYKEYRSVVMLDDNDFIEKLRNKYPDIKLGKDVFSDIKILDHTTGGRVNTIRIGNTTIKGTEFRALFGLNSANFNIEKANGGALKITVLGYGHGVGMSQCGADWLAKKGATFDEILRYYYTGVDLTTIDDYIKINAK